MKSAYRISKATWGSKSDTIRAIMFVHGYQKRKLHGIKIKSANN